MRAIETKTARSKLPVSKNPVFFRLGQGVSIGYRRNAGLYLSGGIGPY